MSIKSFTQDICGRDFRQVFLRENQRQELLSQTPHKVILSAHLHIFSFTPSIHNLFYLQAHVALLIALPSTALAG